MFISILILSVALLSITPFSIALAGLAMLGQPDWNGAAALPYVNQNAPKGGTFVIGHVGSFNNLNPFHIKGRAPYELRLYVHESLGTRDWGEPFSVHGNLASKIFLNKAGDVITFTLDEDATFADGEPVLADDVAFSFHLLAKHGRPNHRSFYGMVDEVTIVNDKTISFHIPASNRELPLILSLMPILPKHIVSVEQFARGDLFEIMGTGPYEVVDYQVGQFVELRRRPGYWGWERMIHKGRFNFDHIRIEYYRDGQALFEAFKAGLVSYYHETDPVQWQDRYDFSRVQNGNVKKYQIPHGRPSGLEGVVLNMRKPPFDKEGVRGALKVLFEQNNIGETLYGGLRQPIKHYFSPLDLGPKPSIAMQRCMKNDAMLEQNSNQVNMTTRQRWRRAMQLLKGEGFTLQNGQWYDPEGKEFGFEIMIRDGASERILVPYTHQLKRFGINATVRVVDNAQFTDRMQRFAFDATIWRWYASLSPGNEQLYYWGTDAADTEGSRNYAGIKSPCIDEAITRLVRADTKGAFREAMYDLAVGIQSTNAIIPFYFDSHDLLAVDSRYALPKKSPLYGYQLETWWSSSQGE